MAKTLQMWLSQGPWNAEIILSYLGGSPLTARVQITGKKKSEIQKSWCGHWSRERKLEDVKLLALKVGIGVTSQGM